MQVGIFNCLFIFVIAAFNDYVIVASIIVIALEIVLILQPYFKYSITQRPDYCFDNVSWVGALFISLLRNYLRIFIAVIFYILLFNWT